MPKSLTPIAERACEECGQQYAPVVKWQRYCKQCQGPNGGRNAARKWREMSDEEKEERKAAHTEWRRRNPEKAKALADRRRATPESQDYMKRYGAVYYQKHRKRLLALNKANRTRQAEELREKARRRHRKVRDYGWQVYFWCDSADPGMPFYVGKGLRGRETESHHRGRHTRLAKSEIKRRAIGDRFEVIIVDDGLTEAESLVIESHYIRTLVPECNECPGHRIKDTLRLFAGA